MHAREAHQGLDALGTIDEGEAAVRLAYAECLLAVGSKREALAVIDVACQRLRERAAAIPDPDLRKRFLCDVPVHARTLQLATIWTGSFQIVEDYSVDTRL